MVCQNVRKKSYMLSGQGRTLRNRGSRYPQSSQILDNSTSKLLIWARFLVRTLSDLPEPHSDLHRALSLLSIATRSNHNKLFPSNSPFFLKQNLFFIYQFHIKHMRHRPYYFGAGLCSQLPPGIRFLANQNVYVSKVRAWLRTLYYNYVYY